MSIPWSVGANLTKHIEVHYHYVWEKALLGLIDLVYVSIEDQVADIFTKALGAKKLRKFKDLLGVQELGLSSRGSVEISSSTRDMPGWLLCIYVTDLLAADAVGTPPMNNSWMTAIFMYSSSWLS